MKTEIKDLPKEKFQEDTKVIDTISSEEDNSENNDQNDSPKNNLASFITTPYERVLSIINEAKAFILSVSSTQQNLIKGLEWAIKVISSHNLYTYELKDHEETEDFKQFVQFMNSYNNDITTNKKASGKKPILISSLNLKRPNALKYSINKIEEEKQGDETNDKKNKEKNKNKKINENKLSDKIINNTTEKKEILNTDINITNKNKEEKNNKINNKNNNNKKISELKEIRNKFYKNNINKINTNNTNVNNINNTNQQILRNIPKNNNKLIKSENSKTQKNIKLHNKIRKKNKASITKAFTKKI